MSRLFREWGAQMDKYKYLYHVEYYSNNTLLISDCFVTEDQALKFAKKISKENKDAAQVRAAWYNYDLLNNLELNSNDLNYLVEFTKGERI